MTLSSTFPGTVATINARQGFYVKKDSTLAVIESQSVQSAYDMASATLRQAEDGYRRLMQVKETNSVPDIKIIEIETKLAQARAQYEASAKSLNDCRIRAPFSGVIASVNVECGIRVQPLEPIIKLYDMSALEIHISVPETEIGQYNLGDTALVVVPALNNRRITATLYAKGIDASSVSHTYNCIFKVVGNHPDLMPGMTTKVLIDHTADYSIVIPSSVIRLDQNGKYVWVVVDAIVEKRYITLGEFSGKGVVVTKGLNIGDQVITDGNQKVSIGSHVTIKE